MSENGITIGALASEAGVGVETIRYYQRRGLVGTPGRSGSFRRYSGEHVARVRFIKRAQAFGFSLAEIATLLELNDGANRTTIRAVAGRRLQQIEERIADLSTIAGVLKKVIRSCEHSRRGQPCPIIETILSEERKLLKRAKGWDESPTRP